MGARLLVQLAGAEFAFDLRGESVRVGAASSNGLVLRDPAVGKEHFEVRRVGGAWRLVDLESAAGTRVNGLFVNRQDLRNGDVIAVGEARLTFLLDDAPAPVPAPVPWTPPSAAPAWSAPQAPAHHAPARPGPAHHAPARAHGSHSVDYRGRSAGGGGAGGVLGGMVGVAFLVGIVLAAIALAWKFGMPPDRVDPNPALLARMKRLMDEDKLAEVIKAAEEADPAWPPTAKPIRGLALDAKKRLRERAEVAAEQEAEDYWLQNIKAYREASPDDYANIALRCDEFLRRWPDHARAKEASFVRLRATGEPSPAIAEKGGFVSWAELTRAAEAEAARLLAQRRYGDAFAVYDRFEKAMPRTVLPEYQQTFLDEVNRVRAGITKKAKEAFEKLEEDAMILEDQGKWAESEELYRRARDGFGVQDIRIRCDAELERLANRRMR